MKNIIERKLPLDRTYTLLDKQYVSLESGFGCICDNCGRLIANIATISDNTCTYSIGFDCLDTILTNNMILSKEDIADYVAYKVALSKIMKFITHLKQVLAGCKSVTGLRFEPQNWESDYYTFYYLHNNSLQSRDNSNVKIKGITFDLLYKIVSEHFKQLTIL